MHDSTATSTATPNVAVIGRRHDLDALRAFAMLLGIALHGALSFMPMLWPIQDGRQNALFGWFVSAVHGFRMPVFFVMSCLVFGLARRVVCAIHAFRLRRFFNRSALRRGITDSAVPQISQIPSPPSIPNRL